MPHIDIRVATSGQKPAVANLFQLYVHDFSEQWAGRPEGELEEDGRFGVDDSLDAYWTRPDHVALVVRIEGRLAGFALVDADTHSGLPADRNMGEFFIVRKHRRIGAGTAVAQAIFARYPGLWEVAVARANVGALLFWRRAIAGCARAADVEEIDIRSAAWDGAILRFRAGSDA